MGMRMTRRLAIAVVSVAAALGAGASAPAAVAGPREDAARLAQAMRTRKLVNVKFDGASLDELVKWLKVATGWNWHVKRDVIAKAGVDLDALKVKVDLDDVTVATLMDIVLSPHALVAHPVGNIVFVTTKADALGKPYLLLHPISHLTWTKTNFRGPDIDLHPSGYVAPEDKTEGEEIDETDPFRDPAHVVELVKQVVDAPWETEGWSITATTTFLAVKAPRDVQRRVMAALEQLAALK
jgi:hypothetical protein